MTTSNENAFIANQAICKAQQQALVQNDTVGLLRLSILGFLFISASLFLHYSTFALVLLIIPSRFLILALARLKG